MACALNEGDRSSASSVGGAQGLYGERCSSSAILRKNGELDGTRSLQAVPADGTCPSGITHPPTSNLCSSVALSVRARRSSLLELGLIVDDERNGCEGHPSPMLAYEGEDRRQMGRSTVAWWTTGGERRRIGVTTKCRGPDENDDDDGWCPRVRPTFSLDSIFDGMLAKFLYGSESIGWDSGSALSPSHPS